MVAPRRSFLRRPAVEPGEIPAVNGYRISLCHQIFECAAHALKLSGMVAFDHGVRQTNLVPLISTATSPWCSQNSEPCRAPEQPRPRRPSEHVLHGKYLLKSRDKGPIGCLSSSAYSWLRVATGESAQFTGDLQVSPRALTPPRNSTCCGRARSGVSTATGTGGLCSKTGGSAQSIRTSDSG